MIIKTEVKIDDSMSVLMPENLTKIVSIACDGYLVLSSNESNNHFKLVYKLSTHYFTSLDDAFVKYVDYICNDLGM